ncbi:MAG: hypothetical protein ACJ74Q_21275 [Pyrinomonadaceae bacterium]
MLTAMPKNRDRAARGASLGRRAALVLGLLTVTCVCAAQTIANASEATALPASTPTPEPTPSPDANNINPPPPLTAREREMLRLIGELQERVSKLEAQASETSRSGAADASAAPGSEEADSAPPPAGSTETETPATPASEAKARQQTEGRRELGRYTPNLGFKLADTEYGDLSVSIYTYVRYLNQLGLDETYTDAFGNVKGVQRRQDMQLLKLQFKFLGWVLNPKLRYFLYAWTSNANQGQGAQVVLAGNLQYAFSKYFTLGGGIRSLPGTRSVEGNFPFWSNVDSRMIADEFMRPSYTSGIWATGELATRLKYQAMLGNNMSTLGVSAARIDNGLNTFSGALIWFPTGDFEKGFSGQGWGDFEHHDKFSTRLGVHVSRSDENKESQPGSDSFENTQLRLSDGSIIFTPDLFGDGITITDARWRMATVDGGFKYHGYSLEGEYFWRWLDNFKSLTPLDAAQTQRVPGRVFDHAFQIQGSAMVVPKTLQAYVGHSRIYGDYGNPWDFRAGANWFPFKNKVLRWNNEALYLRKSPVGYTSVPFAVGGNGFVFHSSLEMAF